MRTPALSTMLLVLFLTAPASAQKSPHPQIGYVFPPGGRAGETVEVKLGGFDWTPDLQFFVLDTRVKLQIVSPLSKLIMPRPPYLVGPKAYGPPPLPREVIAKLTLPADMPPGPIRWQVANANGSSETGVFLVGTGSEVVENAERTDPQPLANLPATVYGRVSRNEEVDRYVIEAMKSGPIVCELTARRIGSKFNGVLELHDADGRMLTDAVDSRGMDPWVAFSAQAGRRYTLSVRDLDFRGNRAFVYRLNVTAGPRVLAAIPAAGRHGESRTIEFVGIGVASGEAKLESVKHSVTFPQSDRTSFEYRLKTAFGTAPPFRLLVSDLTEHIEPAQPSNQARMLDLPTAVTGILEQRFGTDRYRFQGKKGEQWQIDVQAARISSAIDVKLAIFDSAGKQLAGNDDLPGTTDAGLQWTFPADGAYELSVSDTSGQSGSRASVYRLIVQRPPPGFTLQIPQHLNVLTGGKAELQVKAIRQGGFKQPITLSVSGLPEGISVAADLVIPGDKSELKVPLTSAKDAPATASLVTVTGTARVGDGAITRTATAKAAGNLAPRTADDNSVTMALVASTLKPRVKIRPVESDERTVHRGSTHLAPVAIERLEGFDGDVIIQMEGTQPSKFRQGILGPDVVLPRGANRVFYPCFVPELAETLDAYRFSLIGVAKVPDPRGNIRYMVCKMNPNTSIAITVEGALLKIASNAEVLQADAGETIEIPLKISRSVKLTQPVRLELIPPSGLAGLLTAQPLAVPRKQGTVTVRVASSSDPRVVGQHTLTIRAIVTQRAKLPALSGTANCTPLQRQMLTLLKSGFLPVLAETRVPVKIRTAAVAKQPAESR